MKCEISYMYLGRCFREDGGSLEDVKIIPGERLKTLRILKKMCNIRSLSLG